MGRSRRFIRSHRRLQPYRKRVGSVRDLGELDLGESDYAGKSYNVYNPDLKRWEQFWVDNVGGMIHFYGGLKDGVMDFYTDEIAAARRHQAEAPSTVLQPLARQGPPVQPGIDRLRQDLESGVRLHL